ncbi:SUN-domain-containing protein [Metschnikowia bicuspidata var. bicuspidata NRRL YB-4993]|uniref:SUN-domain-containing protein n=1 Tax=Metschnikowia bicuspidata var. bicuspidata NRRL YB-4993 TaxID=869754 RepID=A0A1A0HID1_9ASCO|nr:SUN-domain-containing protein [Metschnikowia bicuspidata var. bicuspidata NRRL YB-4993]OBA23642.1 SUN-domain-containing protein [Metschnikowia bicuspidata var. bicuspidata NRRL YB-4993]
MRLEITTLYTLALAFASLAAAAPAKRDDEDCSTTQYHRHHQHRREVVIETEVITVTVDGELATTTSATTSKIPDAAETTQSPSTAKIDSESATLSTSTSTSVSSSSGSVSADDISGDLESYVDPTTKFVDGTIACSSFPGASGQGIINLDHLGFGGFSGIYNSDTSTGGSCEDGSYCSYACQLGMSKTQWPSEQPSNGVSVGGLLCKDGYLYRTNTDTDYLCEWGVDSAVVVSELDETVAICRTDYPGTENMVIPTVVDAGETSILTVVNQETYYTTNSGGKTSAQYYVNNAGVSWKDGCLWGTSGSGVGNWAPLNFGAGYDSGVSYLSLIKNPNNVDAANFNVKIEGESDATTVGSCSYEAGIYTSSSGDNTDGCTLSVTSGRGQFILYN